MNKINVVMITTKEYNRLLKCKKALFVLGAGLIICGVCELGKEIVENESKNTDINESNQN